MAHLLLVDDDPVLLQLLATLFRRSGHQVDAAGSAAEGLALAGAQRFDLIITDVMMPDLDGYELTARLRAQPATAETPILILTSRLQGPDQELARRAGATACAMKTVNVERLGQLVDSLLAPQPISQEA